MFELKLGKNKIREHRSTDATWMTHLETKHFFILSHDHNTGGDHTCPVNTVTQKFASEQNEWRALSINNCPWSFAITSGARVWPHLYLYKILKKRTVHLTRFLLRQGEPGTSQYIPKGVHSCRYFLQPMRTANSFPSVHTYSPITTSEVGLEFFSSLEFGFSRGLHLQSTV